MKGNVSEKSPYDFTEIVDFHWLLIVEINYFILFSFVAFLKCMSFNHLKFKSSVPVSVSLDLTWRATGQSIFLFVLFLRCFTSYLRGFFSSNRLACSAEINE